MTERCHEQTRAFLDFHLSLFLCLPVSLSTCTLGKVGWTPEAWSQMHQKLSFVAPPQDFLSSLIPLLQLAARGCWTGWLSLGDSDQYMRCGSPMDPICNPKSLLPSYGPLDKLINWPNNNVGIPCNLSFGQYSFSSPCILKGIKMAQMVKPCRTKHSQSHEFHRVGCTEGQMDPSAVCKS